MGKFVDEIQRIQRTVDLADWATRNGWEKDTAKSSSKVIALRSGGVKVLAREQNRLPGWRFKECVGADLSGGRHGDVVDFVAWHLQISTADAVKELTGYQNTKIIPSGKTQPATDAVGGSEATRAHLLTLWSVCRPFAQHPYLHRRRGLCDALQDARFVDTYRNDARGNAVFPQFDRHGLVGLERRNVNFKGMETGSMKALWHSRNLATASSIVFCESPIDCMSHFELYGGDSAYVSLGGVISELQKNLIAGLIRKAESRGAVIIAGFDNDSGGDGYTELLNGYATIRIDRILPIDKDFNEDLMKVRHESS